MTLQCPSCPARLRTQPRQLGRTVHCPRCGASVDVPAFVPSFQAVKPRRGRWLSLASLAVLTVWLVGLAWFMTRPEPYVINPATHPVAAKQAIEKAKAVVQKAQAAAELQNLETKLLAALKENAGDPESVRFGKVLRVFTLNGGMWPCPDPADRAVLFNARQRNTYGALVLDRHIAYFKDGKVVYLINRGVGPNDAFGYGLMMLDRNSIPANPLADMLIEAAKGK